MIRFVEHLLAVIPRMTTDIRQHLRAEPFIPFTVHVADDANTASRHLTTRTFIPAEAG